MKNKQYRVWITQGYSVDIDAKEIQIVTLHDRPLKIEFVGENNCILAEFYCDMINGWAQINCINQG